MLINMTFCLYIMVCPRNGKVHIVKELLLTTTRLNKEKT